MFSESEPLQLIGCPRSRSSYLSPLYRILREATLLLTTYYLLALLVGSTYDCDLPALPQATLHCNSNSHAQHLSASGISLFTMEFILPFSHFCVFYCSSELVGSQASISPFHHLSEVSATGSSPGVCSQIVTALYFKD